MTALEAYNLRTALLIAGAPSGSDRAATAPVRGDHSALVVLIRLSAAEIARPMMRTLLDPRVPPETMRGAGVASSRLGERAAWTDPPGL